MPRPSRRDSPNAEANRLRRAERELARQIEGLERTLADAPDMLARAAEEERRRIREQATIDRRDASTLPATLDDRRAAEQRPDLSPRKPTRVIRINQARDAQRRLLLLLLVLAVGIAILLRMLPR